MLEKPNPSKGGDGKRRVLVVLVDPVLGQDLRKGGIQICQEKLSRS
jgi:hypothetical protein